MVTETKPLSEYYPHMVGIASNAMLNSYSPYSKFRVGACVMTVHRGEIRMYYGTNIENASYGLTICAERVAFAKAVADGVRDFRAIAIVTDNDNVLSCSCGACRQFMYEFNPDLHVFISNREGTETMEYILRDLLPAGFGPKSLGKEV